MQGPTERMVRECLPVVSIFLKKAYIPPLSFSPREVEKEGVYQLLLFQRLEE